MRATFSLGRIAGVRIGVHWSVVVIFAIIVGGLSIGWFPAAFPDLGLAAHLTAGVVTAVAFFLSLLAHEMSHALVARRNGLPADDITLWLFGGVAQLGGEAPDPAAEMRIAGVGPLVSLVLGVLFLLAAGGLFAAGIGGLVPVAGLWLGGINVALAVFNTVPAAPLDGGRLLRAFVWWRTGDRLRATVVAARAGQVLGWLMIGGGLLLFFATAGFGGLWLALLGWFLVMAAGAENVYATTRGRLGDRAVRELMTPDPVTLPGSTTVAQLLEGDEIRSRHSTFPLTDEAGAPTGLMTFSQVRRVPPEQRTSTTLAQIGCPMSEVTAVDPDEPAAELLARLSECAEGRALVTRGGAVVGIVSPSDVSRALRWGHVTADRR